MVVLPAPDRPLNEINIGPLLTADEYNARRFVAADQRRPRRVCPARNLSASIETLRAD
jgi:hypothetical protein